MGILINSVKKENALIANIHIQELDPSPIQSIPQQNDRISNSVAIFSSKGFEK
jgi:hypothetical protein